MSAAGAANPSKRRHIDFAVLEGDTVRIAIEVDGFDKTGSGRGMSRAEFVEWSRREQAMVAAGWRPIRVANALVDREPDRTAAPGPSSWSSNASGAGAPPNRSSDGGAC